MTDHYAEAELRLRQSTNEDSDLRSLAYSIAGLGYATLAAVQHDADTDRFLDAMQGVRTIPWPPSEAVVERVARELAALDGRPWDALLPVRQDDYRAKARAVLDAIGGEA